MIQFKEYLSESKGLHVFDIDETLMKTNAKIHVKDKNGNHVESLDNQQFNDHKLHPNHHYDFSEFRDSKKFHDESAPIHPMIRKVQALQRNIKAGGHKSKIIMNTARADFDDKKLVLDKFRKHGIDMDNMHLHRAGNIEGNQKPAEKKNVILRKHLDSGNYDHVHMYDDSKTNLDHFNGLQKEYPHIKFHAHHVDHAGKTKKHVTEEIKESMAKNVAIAIIALKAGLPHHEIVQSAGESQMWRIPSKGAMVPKRIAKMRKTINVPTIKVKNHD